MAFPNGKAMPLAGYFGQKEAEALCRLCQDPLSGLGDDAGVFGAFQSGAHAQPGLAEYHCQHG